MESLGENFFTQSNCQTETCLLLLVLPTHLQYLCWSSTMKVLFYFYTLHAPLLSRVQRYLVVALHCKVLHLQMPQDFLLCCFILITLFTIGMFAGIKFRISSYYYQRLGKPIGIKSSSVSKSLMFYSCLQADPSVFRHQGCTQLKLMAFSSTSVSL